MKRKLENVDTIIVHCLDTPVTMDVGKKEVDEWHRARGFSSCGYHYIVRLDGSIETCRPLNHVGAHAKGYNLHSIGIAYAGGAEGVDTRNLEQMGAMFRLIKALVTVLPNIKDIHGHNEVSTKACPNFNARAEYKQLLPC